MHLEEGGDRVGVGYSRVAKGVQQWKTYRTHFCHQQNGLQQYDQVEPLVQLDRTIGAHVVEQEWKVSDAIDLFLVVVVVDEGESWEF